MKKQLLMGALASTLMAGAVAPAMAQDVGAGFDLSMNAGLVSNYIWRGMSQSADRVAVQGGLDFKHSSGAYVGTWMSSAQFELGPDVYMEQDTYAGYGLTLGDFAFDLRYTDYHYPGLTAFDFSETHAHVSAFGATFGVDYSNDTPVNDADSTIHYYGSYSTTVSDIGLTATVGEYDFKDAGWVGSMDDKYTYYSVGATKALGGVTFGLTYTGSNVDGDNCAVFMGDEDYCDAEVVFSATKAL